MPQKTKLLFNIWSEGYATGDERKQAILHGQACGSTFKDACNEYAEGNPVWAYYFDPNNLTFWGCRLFDNEEDARRAHG